MSKPASHSFIFDRYRLSVASKELLYEDHPIPLNRIQFEILHILVVNHGEFVKKGKLVNDVYGNSSAGPNAIEQAILNLRGKLHDASKESRFIETKRGMGYRFIANVRKVSDEDFNEKALTVGDAIQDEKLSAQGSDAATQTAQPVFKTVAAEHSKDGMLTFQAWRHGHGKPLTWGLIISVILTVAVSTAFYVSVDTRKWAMPVVCIVQFFVIFFALVYPLHEPKGLRTNREDAEEDSQLNKDIRTSTGYERSSAWNIASDTAKDALERYTKYWQYLLASWLLLYALLTFIGYGGLNLNNLSAQRDLSQQEIALRIATTTFNNCNTLMIILCFFILNEPIINKAGKRKIKDASWTKGAAFVIVFLVIEISLVAVPTPFQKSDILKVTSSVSGIAGGIAMALYFGRLQSKFLGPPPWLLITLYSYTAIQPLFMFLAAPEVWAVILLDVALILKCLLYLYMAWLFQSGRLLFYLVRVRRTYQKVEMEWQDFRKVLEEES
ncbi:MAG TPA: winged helix-turn-helix domain-containing protein [Pyrinomonadaceae bacterium]|nr:winged helix-turn-helix domain-containing protein [Pyrinomonadaceae bacterium]